jgi:predicted DNA-binding protein (MmcQ/YjbR family)
MISVNTVRKLALSFPETSEQPHFEKISFRVGKKIFATYDAKNSQACIKLSAKDQDIFSLYDNTVIFPVPNKWGQQGWTLIDMKKVRKDMFTDALTQAYCEVAPEKLSSSLKKK